MITPDGEADLFTRQFTRVYSSPFSLWEADRVTSIGFLLEKIQRSRKPPLFITDIDFAGDFALLSNYIEEA